MKATMKIVVGVACLSICFALAHAWVYQYWWPDGDDIIMDDVFLPAATWSDPAQYQMSEWNEVDVTDNSHPFRINTDPEMSFGAYDGDNTIGFLDEAGLGSEYGLSYASALAWTSCWPSGDNYVECDVMLDPSLAWSLGPHDSTWFQSTVLHELGHVRGLKHYNLFQSMQNSGQSKYLRGETLYMDDREGVRQRASFVSELDIAIYNKWHDGAVPQWMTMSPTNLREGEVIELNNITVENRGTEAFGSAVQLGIYLSDDIPISTGDQLVNTGAWDSFGVFTYSTFDWTATIPTITDCGTYYIGGIIDDTNAWDERYEGNNAVTFTNGLPYTGSSFTPTSLSLLLAQDGFEPNDSSGAASPITLPFNQVDLTVDEDLQQDYYGFGLACGMRVDTEVTFSHALGDIDLELGNGSNPVIGTSSSGTDDESLVLDLDAGAYFVRVFGDGAGSCNRYSMTIDAVDVTAPVITSPDPITLECNSPGGIPGDDPDIVDWIASATAEDECDGPIADIQNDAPGFFPSACLPGAETQVSFSATDTSGNQGIESSSVTVVDSSAPAVTCAVAESTLWPVDHTMVDVGLTFDAEDICDAAPLAFAVSVTSDERPDEELGSGGPIHCPDAVVGQDLSVQLRAERSGNGDGRVYLITVSATDSCGNEGICQVPVTVPMSMGASGAATDSGQLFDPTTCSGGEASMQSSS